MSHSLKEGALHAGAHLTKEALQTDTGRQAVAVAAGTALVAGKAAVAAAPLLPIAVAGGALYGAYRLLTDNE